MIDPLGGILAFFGMLIADISKRAIPAENWANEEQLSKDRMSGMSPKEILRNAERGKYYLPAGRTNTYPVPHRDPKDNKIVIENYTLYHEELMKYGACQVQKWLDQGKYNLTPEELRKERRRVQRECAEQLGDTNTVEIIDRDGPIELIDYKNTEAVRQWQQACAGGQKK